MNRTDFYINGKWVTPHGSRRHAVINPATLDPAGEIILGDKNDVDDAVASARAAFDSFSRTRVKERVDLLSGVLALLLKRNDEIADAITAEMGAPVGLSRAAQAPSGAQHFGEMIRVLKEFTFEETLGTTIVRKEAIGVCALITPWNWPMNQMATKVAPALGAGCTMVLKPSEIAPLDAIILTEILHEAGTPAGVFNLIHGDGPGVGEALTSHPDVDFVSFTGSTRAGISISKNAASDIKRVALELGGKSAAIILDDADFAKAVKSIVRSCMTNTGQSCNAPTRLLVPAEKVDEANAIAKAVAEAVKVGDPTSPETHMGPISNRSQYEKVVSLIEAGASDGATLIAGGAGKPDTGLPGYFVAPTVFSDVTSNMRIAKEEIFGPVISIMPYKDRDDAVRIANDTEYGLSGYVWGAEKPSTYEIAARMRTGMVHVNGAPLDSAAPFGGYKKSGIGREWGVYGLEEFLETKSVYGGAALA